MSIAKINLNNTQYANLDINKDSKIDMQDYLASKDNSIKNEILSYLSQADDASELNVSKEATSSNVNEYGIKTTNSNTFDNDVRNTKGTVYVVMGNTDGCGYCRKLEAEIQKNASALGQVATVYDMDWSENSSLCRQIYQQGGGGSSASFPQIAKFVDGEFVGLVDNPRKASTAVQSMISGGTGAATSTRTTGSTSTTNTASNEEKEANNTKIAELKSKIEANNDKIKSYESEIATLTNEIETELGEANDTIASIIAEKEAEFQKLIEEAINEAKNQEVKDGETPKTFSEILASKIADQFGIEDAEMQAVEAAISASSKAQKIDDLTGKISELNSENKSYNSEIDTLEAKNEAIDAEASDTSDSSSSSCDPIGFKQGNAQYDFFIDKDNNGELSNEQEFLGAQNQWQEMEKLDTNKDGKVTKSELEQGNVQMIKTENGKQTVVNAADVFSETDFIDLKSYKSAADGAIYNNNNKQELLGNFNVNISGQNIEGYNTMDDVNWLKSNYNFSDSTTNSTNNFADTNTTNVNNNNELNNIFANIEDTYRNIDVSKDDFATFMENYEEYGNTEGEFYFNNIQSVLEDKNAQKKLNKKS